MTTATIEPTTYLAELRAFIDESGMDDPHEIAEAYLTTLAEADLRERARPGVLRDITREQWHTRAALTAQARTSPETVTREHMGGWIVHVPGRGYVGLLDCTPDELELAAGEMDRRASEIRRRADVYRRVAALTRAKGKPTPRKVPHALLLTAIAEETA